jgi:hypothetical protein
MRVEKPLARMRSGGPLLGRVQRVKHHESRSFAIAVQEIKAPAR